MDKKVDFSEMFSSCKDVQEVAKRYAEIYAELSNAMSQQMEQLISTAYA